MTAAHLSSALHTQQLSKSYGPVTAAQQVDLSLETGQILALLGPSGSGKSTVLRLIAGLERPSSGQIWLQGQNATALPPEARHLGLVFQDYALFPHLRVLDNVAYGLRRRGERRPEAERLAREMLHLVGLDGYEQRRVHELSGGQQQRVALARALAPQPRLLLLDEPLSNLDEQLRISLRRDLRQLFGQLGTTVLLVTHDQREAAALADQVAIMRGGQVVQQGPIADVFERPQSGWVAAFLGYRNLLPSGPGQVLLVPEQAVTLDAVTLSVGQTGGYPVLHQTPSEGGVLVSVQHTLGPLELHLSPREAALIHAGQLALQVDMNRCLELPA